MTGMGDNGAWGMEEMKECGALLPIAQVEGTSVIFDMPGEAIQTGGVAQILPLSRSLPGSSATAAGNEPAPAGSAHMTITGRSESGRISSRA